MTFNGLALIPLALLCLPVLWSVLRQSANDWSLSIEEFRLRRKLRRMNPSDPAASDLMARLASIQS